jgi:hypothetical protein
MKALGGVDKALVGALSTIFPVDKIKFYKEDISFYTKTESYRHSFSEHPLYIGNEKYYSKYAAYMIMDSTTFEKENLKLETEIFGFKITGKYSFMGEVSKFYVPGGLVYSAINNRVETAIPNDILNTVIEVETPAIAIFNMGGGYLNSDRKYYIRSITYLFKESGKYLTVKPFDYSDWNTPANKTTALRFFEFFLNLTQFYNENEKVIPFAYEIIEPSLLTVPMLEKFGDNSIDSAHSHGAKVVIGPINIVSNEYVNKRVNEAYTKARTSFPFLGQHPIKALDNFLAFMRVIYS